MDYKLSEEGIMGTRSFPGGSDGKESACHAGDLGSIPGSGRSPGEGKGYLFSPEESPWTGYSPWSHKESDMIESD